MHRITWFSAILFTGLLLAAEPAWRTKSIAQWSVEDAREVLTTSPWAKATALTTLPARSEAQLREGGKMGGSKLTGIPDPSRPGKVAVRWESAGPIRSAEVLAGEAGAPDWDGDYYAIAIYDIPGIPQSEQKSLAGELKQTASLKRAGMKDLKPVRVTIDQLGNGRARILYLFSRSAELTKDDPHVEFVAQIGRLCATQFFDLGQMQFLGKLEL
jgi:hypothetical protein